MPYDSPIELQIPQIAVVPGDPELTRRLQEIYDSFIAITDYINTLGGGGTVTNFSAVPPAEGITTAVANPTTTPQLTLNLANDLSALEGLSGTGIAKRTGVDTWALGTVTLSSEVSGLLPVANGGTGTSTPSLVAGANISITGTWPNQTITATAGGGGTVNTVTLNAPATGITIIPSGTAADPVFTFSLANDLAALENLGSIGIAVRSAADTWVQRAIVAGSTKIAITDGNGTAGNPTIDAVEANFTLNNIGGTLGISKGGTGQTTQTAAFNALSPLTTQGDIIYRDAANNVRLAPGTAGQALVTGGGGANPSWKNLLVYNQSTAAQGPGFAADTYLTGSSINVNGLLKAGTRYKLVFDVNKTAAGVAAPTIIVRFGTAGTTADAARATLTFLAQTAAADDGTFEVYVTFRTVGATGVIQAIGTLTHRLQITGLANLPSPTVRATSAAFDTTVANSIIGVSVNGGASASWTVQLVQATLENLA